MGATYPLSIVLGAVDRLSGPLTKLEGKLGKFGKKATEAGKRLTLGITAPTIALGGVALATFSRYESGMLRVKALTGSTAEEQAKLETQTKALGKSTVFTAGEVAGAQGFLAQAGFKVNEILGATPGVLNLAAAAQIDLAEAADITSNILTGYGKDVAELEDVNNILTRTFTQSNTSLSQLGESFKIAGPVASAMGLPMSEVAAVLGKMGDAGFQASLAGTALRGALSRLAKPSAEAIAAFSGLKIKRSDLVDSRGNVKSLTETVRLLEGAGASASDMLTIFGERAGPAMTALVQGGADAIAELQGNLLEGTTAAEIAELQMSGLTGAMARLRSAAEGVAIAVAESGLAEWVGQMATSAAALFTKLSNANPQLLKMGTIALGVAAAVGPLLLLVGQASLGIQGLASAAQFLGPALSTVGGVLFKTMIPAVWSFTTALLANPIGAIVAAVVALGVALVVLAQKNEKVRKVLTMAWSAIKNVFMLATAPMFAVLDALLEGLAAVWNFFGSDIPAATPRPSSAQGVDIAPAAIAAVASGGGVGPGRSSETRVAVDFSNLPPGVTVTADDIDEEVELGLGYALGGIA